MSAYLIVLLLAAMPALGNFAGGVLAEMVPVSRRVLNLVLHAAGGIVIGVVAVEIVPRAVEADPAWLIVLAFVLGGGFYVATGWVVERLQSRFGDENGAGPWMIFFGVSTDLFSDGVLIGTGSTISVGLGLLLAVGQVPADFPEGFSSTASFRRAGAPRRKRLLLLAAFAIPIFAGATLGYWAMRDAPEIYQLALLTFTAGILTTLVVEELVPEAHEALDEGEGRLAPLVFVGGFALFALLSAYLG